MPVPWPLPRDLEPPERLTAWFSGAAQQARRSLLGSRLRLAVCEYRGCESYKTKKRRPCRFDLLRGVSYCSEACWLAYTEPVPERPAARRLQEGQIVSPRVTHAPTSHTHEFRYDRATDCVLCPCGERLEAPPRGAGMT